jgi:hypothetical protein
MATRDYSSVNSIREFALTELAPKYFEVNDINQLNTGLFAYVTDLIANTTEDTMNSLSMYIREIFPNIAELPETLYNNAARLQIDQLMATAASMDVILFISEKDILSKGTPRTGGRIEFILDSNMIIDIEGVQFMLDYDIIINAKSYRGDYIFSAAYNMNFNNSLSQIKNPYVKTRRVKIQNEKYLGLIVTVHQVNRFEQLETLISNDRINLPTLSFEYNDQLANFEVFYRPPGATEYTQLIKRLFNSTPLKEPFCFYKLKDDQTVEITFTLKEQYFQPQFNSEILIRYYTTKGDKGNFPLYTGNNFVVIPQSEVYEYNNNLIVMGIAQTESRGGRGRLSLEELRSLIVERISTMGAYTTENDLQLFFDNNKSILDSNVLFVKRRDDALERLFSAFSLFKDKNGDIYPTNTLDLEIDDNDFDDQFDVSGRFLFRPGHLFRYKGNSADIVENIRGKTLSDDLSDIPEEFIFTNPYLIVVTKSPGIVGYYLNSVKSGHVLDYSYVNNDSPIQFIANNLSVSRNALIGEDFYTLRITLMPTTDEELNVVDDSGHPTGNLIVKGTIQDESSELCMFDFSLVSADTENNFYTFEAKLSTDDYMTMAEKFRVKNVFDLDDKSIQDKVIPMYSAIINLHAFYKFPDTKINHKYDYISELYPYTLTNTYSTIDDRVNFITPINSMRSQIKYIERAQNPTPDPDLPPYYMRISFVPFVKASTMKIKEQYENLINLIYKQYNFLQSIFDLIKNNFGIDMKFYKTYGRSKNFTVGENNARLDKVNISIKFSVYPVIGTVEADLIRDLKIFIKNFIENINNSGYNSIYVSNLIREIENNFSEVEYLKFVRINNYNSSVQVIRNRGINIESMTKEELRQYVPEYLTIGLDDIIIDIINEE